MKRLIWLITSLFILTGCSFYEDIPCISYTTSKGIIKEKHTFFLLEYQVYFMPAGIARFPDGGIPDYKVDKIFLISCNHQNKKLSVIKELNTGKYDPIDVKGMHPEKHKNNFYISLSYYLNGSYDLHSGIFLFDEQDSLKFLLEGRYPKFSSDGQMAYLKDSKPYLQNSEKPLFETPPVYLFKWKDKNTLIFKPRTRKSDSIVEYKLETGKKIIHKNQKYVDSPTLSISDTREYFDGIFYPPAAGLPDPFQYFKSSKKRLLSILINKQEEGNKYLKNAILGKMLEEEAFQAIQTVGEKTEDKHVKRMIKNLLEKDKLSKQKK
jgi:hypothetical protein